MTSQTDEFGRTPETQILSGKEQIGRDHNATMLHLLGLDHTKLVYRYAGRDFRLTNIHGEVVHEIIA